MAQAPRNGPTLRKTNAQRQPTAASIGGTRCTETIVSRNPTQVCTVTIVPTRSGSESSTTLAENCAESATATIPQKMQKPASSQGGAPNRKPADSEQPPLNSIAPMVSRVRPKRSASTPPARHPIAPKPIVAKAPSLAQNDAAVPIDVSARLACRKAAIQVHMA